MKTIFLIGAGGVGSWLAPALGMLLNNKSNAAICIVDGDKLETKNLNRQLFSSEDVGKFKSDVLAQRYAMGSLPKWFSYGMTQFDPSDVLMVGVDNHMARLDALRTCDQDGCMAIIGANETYSAEAYVYLPEWRDTQLDPRVFYPEILTDKSNDPRAGVIGCTGEEQVKTPQLVTANFMAAALMQHLFIVWVLEARKFDEVAREHLPHKLTSNQTKMFSEKAGKPTPAERK